MSENAKTLLTEWLVGIWVTFGLSSYLPTLNMVLDAIFTCISIVSVIFILIINWDKFYRRIQKFGWFKKIFK